MSICSNTWPRSVIISFWSCVNCHYNQHLKLYFAQNWSYVGPTSIERREKHMQLSRPTAWAAWLDNFCSTGNWVVRRLWSCVLPARAGPIIEISAISCRRHRNIALYRISELPIFRYIDGFFGVSYRACGNHDYQYWMVILFHLPIKYRCRR